MINQIRILLFTGITETSQKISTLLNEININAQVIVTNHPAEFASNLQNKRPDVVVIDYPEISFEGLSALSILKAGNHNLQIIFINENNNENENKDRIKTTEFKELETVIRQVSKVAPSPDEVGFNRDAVTEMLNMFDEPAFFVKNDLVFAVNERFGQLFGTVLPIILGNKCNNIFSFKNEDKIFSKRNLPEQKGEIYSPYLPEKEKYKFRSQQLNERCVIFILSQMKVEEKLSVRKKENNFSYDVRTLMNSVLGYSMLLNDQLREAKDNNYFSVAEKILQNSKTLFAKLEGTEDMEKISPEPEEIDVRAAIERIVKDFSEHEGIPNPNITQTIKTNLSAIFDESLFRRGFVNLLSSIHRNFDDASIGFETGIETSLPVVLLKMYFDKGEYSMNEIESFNNSGENFSSLLFGQEIIWLKEVLKKMKASFHVSTMPRGGLMLDIGLPRHVKTTNPVKDAVYITGSPDLIYLFERQPNILIVEDHLDSLKMLEITLNKVSHLESSTSSTDAIKMIEEKISKGGKYDLCLFDIGLPEPMDGIQLMYEVKKRWNEYTKVPFIAQTAFALRDEKNLILRAGFDAFVSKPIDRKLLIKVIATALKQNTEI